MLPIPTGPLVITLTIDSATQSFLTSLRKRYFPPHRNHLNAHITLFHAIPPHRIQEVDGHIRKLINSQGKPFDIYIGEPRTMGYKGVMLNIRERPSGKIENLHGRLLRYLKAGVKDEKDKLTNQDMQGMRSAHVTVLNKAEKEEEVEKCLEEVKRLFEDMKRPGDKEGQQRGKAIGLELWEYLGGPWKSIKQYTFQESGDPIS